MYHHIKKLFTDMQTEINKAQNMKNINLKMLTLHVTVDKINKHSHCSMLIKWLPLYAIKILNCNYMLLRSMIACRVLRIFLMLYYCLIVDLEYERCMRNELLRRANITKLYLQVVFVSRFNMICFSQHSPIYGCLHRHDPPDNCPPL